jgi:hypothetical protein
MTASAQRRMDRGEHRTARIAGQSWRLSFYDGFVEAVGERLRQARERAVAQAQPMSAGSTSGPSAELVLRDKAERVKSFYETASQARGSWRGAATGRTQTSGKARMAGMLDGQRADLGQPGLRERGRLGA